MFPINLLDATLLLYLGWGSAMENAYPRLDNCDFKGILIHMIDFIGL